ncbi:terminase TerL endonuclease subunit [Chloroflexota bacterium]
MALQSLSPKARDRLLADAVAEAKRRVRDKAHNQTWPEHYVNSERGHRYQPHHDAERDAVFGFDKRFVLMRGGEGSGKTTAGAIKALERIKLGIDGIAVAPDFPHFKKSTWPEFRRWIPWDFVIERQRRYQSAEWSPSKPFELVFTTGAVVYCGGIDEPESWDGPNVGWAWFDEARRKKDPQAIKVLNGRVRIPGPNGEPPQLWLTTTPRKHWLYDYFGPVLRDPDGGINDPLLSFKDRRLDVVMKTADNIIHLDEGYVEDRAAGLTEAEKIVLLEGGWEDIDDGERFLAAMLWWDNCRETLPVLDKRETLVVAADASVSGDSFAVVGVTRHPNPNRRETDIAIRYIREWKPINGQKLEYSTVSGDGPEDEMRRLCQQYNVVVLTYDEYQLHDMMTRFKREGLVWVKPFPQGAPRLEADSDLHKLIMRRGLAHDGNMDLRRHIDNADRKMDDQHRRMRLVKRSDSQKIDLAVATSMAAYECLRLNL